MKIKKPKNKLLYINDADCTFNPPKNHKKVNKSKLEYACIKRLIIFESVELNTPPEPPSPSYDRIVTVYNKDEVGELE